MAKYIYENKYWADFSYQNKAINLIFAEIRLMQDKIKRQMNTLGLLQINNLER
jgi:hypothetical protein